MEIDIIDFTDEQFVLLSPEQIREVEDAQLKKNNLLRALAERKRKEKYRLVEAGIYRSMVFEKLCEKLDLECEEKVDNIREGLLFFLRFSSVGSSSASAPYHVSYALSYVERFNEVKAYYDNTYANDLEKFEAYVKDNFACVYLGEYYGYLYDIYAVAAGV